MDRVAHRRGWLRPTQPGRIPIGTAFLGAAGRADALARRVETAQATHPPPHPLSATQRNNPMTIALMIASAVTGYGTALIVQGQSQGRCEIAPLVLGMMAFLVIGVLKAFGDNP